MTKRIFTCKDFKGHYPVGSAAVIVADDETDAMRYLTNALQKAGLPQPNPFTIQEFSGYGCTILCDGDY